MTSKPPIDLLTLFGRFGHEQRISLRDPKSLETFVRAAKDTMADALSNDSLLYGQRTQNMFEALMVSLGHYKLLKIEDTGLVHPEGSFTAPDFRVVLKDGSQWLVEVKNVFDPNPGRQRLRLREVDVARLTDYAGAMGCPLKLALYWARWRLWTLIDPKHLVAAGGKLSIDMFKAVAVNELAQLGDRMLGTRPPLKLRLIVDRSKPHSLAPDGEARFWIGDVAILCGDKIIHDPIEQRIAWTLMQFGDWESGGPYAGMSGDDDLGAIEFVWTPRERPNKEEDFEMIGTLSSMFSRYYAEQTLSKEGIIQTEADLIPDWFRPLVDAGCKTKVLPLWRFVIQPNRNVQCKEAEAVT